MCNATLTSAVAKVIEAGDELRKIVGLPTSPTVELVESVTVARRGRYAGESAVGEPLLGIAEDARPACLGACDAGHGGPPTTLAFERATPGTEGFAFEALHEEKLPRDLVRRYRSDHKQCLPWVRVVRDPVSFSACLARAKSMGPMDDPKHIYKLTHDWLAAQDQEVFLAVLLDSQLHVRGISEIVRGARDGVQVPVPDVLRIVLVEGARAFTVVHNHPSGLTVQPSEADIDLTKTIAKAARQVQVPLLDHVIVGMHRYFSFAQDKKLKGIVQ